MFRWPRGNYTLFSGFENTVTFKFSVASVEEIPFIGSLLRNRAHPHHQTTFQNDKTTPSLTHNSISNISCSTSLSRSHQTSRPILASLPNPSLIFGSTRSHHLHHSRQNLPTTIYDPTPEQGKLPEHPSLVLARDMHDEKSTASNWSMTHFYQRSRIREPRWPSNADMGSEWRTRREQRVRNFSFHAHT